MSSHGWVTPLPGGAVARCGGPGMCAHCMAEQIVARGCPTSGERCLYCARILWTTGDLSRLQEHRDDCIWLPFKKAFS